MALQIVFGSEQALAARLALALGDGAESVEPAGDGREEPLLGLHVRRDRPEQRRLRLIGAIGPPQALDGGVGLPSGLQEIMHPQAAVLGRQFRVIGAPGATGVREDEDALGVVHEGLRLGEIGRTRAVLDSEAIDAVRPGLADDPA